MNGNAQIHALGQSLWLDNITRDILDNGTLQKYIDTLSVTGLTSNPSIFQKAIAGTESYDSQIRELLAQGLDTEPLFFELAISDLTRAADHFKNIHEQTGGVDGFVSLEVSPLLANDTENTIAQAKNLHAKANRPNLFIKVPGTREGLPAIEELIFSGVPINVTLLFSREQYLAAAEAYTRGIERRIEAGLDPNIESVASVFISRWDKATMGTLTGDLKDSLGTAIAQRTYKSYVDFTNGERWGELKERGARPQRLLWASTGTKDPALPKTFYITGLAAPNTVNTMPENTLLDLEGVADVDGVMPPDGGNCEETLAKIGEAGVDVVALAEKLQIDGRDSFDASWKTMIDDISSKTASMAGN
ncbi:MAG: transaldolase [Phycisphaerales bacterium]|nr:transaldolase [Phycisphaerales bacterium]